MYFNKSLTSLSVVLLFAASAQAANIVAYGGTDCTGSVGNTVPCDGSCRSFTGRHSLKISGGGNNCVTVYNQANCGNARYDQWTAFWLNSGVCHHVNTGYSVASFRCTPNVCTSW